MQVDPLALKEYITDELFKAMGISPLGTLRRWMGPMFSAPTRRFARLMADVDTRIAQVGFPRAAGELVPHFAHQTHIVGSEHLPACGPLLIATNHPGAFDSVVLSSIIRRDDLKIIASGVPFLRHLPSAAEHLIFVSGEVSERMAALRAAIRHVHQGGALLLFATGLIDPDPDVLPGAEESLARWSGSIEIVARAVPDVQIVMCMISGVLSRTWANHPLTWMQKGMDRRRLAEFFQIMQQLLLPRSLTLEPRITFMPCFTPGEILVKGKTAWMEEIHIRAVELFKAHMLNADSAMQPSREPV
jgi:hypothetical protein